MRLALSFFISFFTQFVLLLLARKTGLFLDRVSTNKPQKFHKTDTPRCGGIGIFLGSLVIATISTGKYILLSSFPCFFAGTLEDLKSNISPKARLFMTLLSPIMAIILYKAFISNLGYFNLPYLISILFTIIAVSGLINAINIIDGFNGLASGVSILSLLSFLCVSYLCKDHKVFEISFIVLLATFGFFVLNFPYGKIFLGDGGAYFLGFSLSQISILLVNRNPEISPWFPAVLFAYPVWEVIFSMYRRKVKKNGSSMRADRMHLHTLIHKRLVRSNPKTSLIILVANIPFFIFAILFRNHTKILTILTLALIISYNLIYWGIVKFKLEKIVNILKLNSY